VQDRCKTVEQQLEGGQRREEGDASFLANEPSAICRMSDRLLRHGQLGGGALDTQLQSAAQPI